MDVTRRVMIATARSGELKTPLNQFARIRTLIDPDVKDVVRISRNSLWSHGFVDLQDEPYVYSQPDTKGRFIVMQALNMWTDDFASSGRRTTGTERGNFALQDELELTPLSAWGAPYSPPHDVPIDATVDRHDGHSVRPASHDERHYVFQAIGGAAGGQPAISRR
jgi:hypothetical protein